MKKQLLLIFSVFICSQLSSQSSFTLTPFMQQSGIYYSSNHIGAEGYGFGAGAVAVYKEHYLFQTDANIYWINGNAFSYRLAAGYKKQGIWSPAMLGSFSVLFGSRTEILQENGQRPDFPVCSFGLRIAPARFENEKGFISLFELGYSIGKDNSIMPEFSLIAIGLKLSHQNTLK